MIPKLFNTRTGAPSCAKRIEWDLNASDAQFSEGRYEFTVHALEEMDEDDLAEADVRQAALHGNISAELTDDPRGTRFVVRGTTSDKEREMELVCRFLPSGLLRIITVYQSKD